MSSYGTQRLWMYFLDHTQFIVTSLTAFFLLYTRSAGVAYFILGALSCSTSVKLVKKLVRQPRPIGKSKKLSYGMPSTHSATITYYASYISAACFYLPLHKSLEYKTSSDASLVKIRNLVPFVIIPWATMVVCSRVWLGHHTWKQVAVGSAYGACFAGVWFSMWVWTGLDVLGIQMENMVVKLLEFS